jgi:uncharacterized membrane protein
LIFAVYPAVSKNAGATAMVLGALFGFFAYATYDLTNLKTLKDWPLIISLVDIAWGISYMVLAGFFCNVTFRLVL